MAKLELPEEARRRIEETGSASLLIGIAAPVNADELRARAAKAVLGIPPVGGSGVELSLPGLRTVIAFPVVSGSADPADTAATERLRQEPGDALRFLPYSLPANSSSVIPWLGFSTTYQTLFGMARELGVSACAVIGFDLAALKEDLLTALLLPVLDKRFDLAMPVYPQGKFEGLLNSSILSPLTRALYGRRVRFPLAPDFGISAHMLLELEQRWQRMSSPGETLFWPATEAALRDRGICQVRLNAPHLVSAEGMELSTVLAQTVGPLFAEMEVNAPFWQRVRGSQAVEISGAALTRPGEDATADVRPMFESFQLGFRNLQEVWSMVLPPVTILELKRLTRLTADRFRMPDDLWVRIVYDFALAYRLRTLSRNHLLGALTPLYLGWVTSYALEAGDDRAPEAEQRLERLARAYEEGKPYLLSRWRWPDRFHP